jgi:hypothetical protein
MVSQTPKAFHQGINTYVPAMSYAADVIHGQPTAFSLGKPAAAAISALSSNVGGANAVANTFFPLNFVVDCPWGRGIRVDLSAVPGNAPVYEVQGTDYLGQPVAKRFTGSAAATTSTAGGAVAFYRITGVKVITAATNAGNIQLGTLGTLGMPYKANVAWAKEGTPPVFIDPAGIFAKWVKPELTDPLSLTTGDPRGTYAPTTLNGVNEHILGLEGDSFVGATGNGGLHGLKHFFA